MSRRESVGRARVNSQSDLDPPAVRTVSCAVLPPRLPQGMAPPTGAGAGGVLGYDDRLNWAHNEPCAIQEQKQEPVRRKSLLRKLGLTTPRERHAAAVAAADDGPPFVMQQIAYEIWRRHYAKDKDGNYRGTYAPAEDCLLKPDDVQKWRLDDPVTKADLWTRGSEALPVYTEVCAEGPLPEYRVEGERRRWDDSTNRIMAQDARRRSGSPVCPRHADDRCR